MLKKSGFILLGILVLATVLRIYQLNSNPPALFGDEIDVGYQAYSLLKTGKDFYGQSWPLYIHSLAEYRAPLFIYATIPFVAIFGLDSWGVRLSAVFWGVMSVVAIYLLARKLFGERVGLIAAFFMAISPWSLQFSRAGFEVTMLLSFVILGVYFFLLGLQKKGFLLLAAFFFGCSFYIYRTALVFVPLLLLLLGGMYINQLFKIKKHVVLFAIILGILVFPNVLLIINGQASQRFGLVSIFQDSVLLDKINLARKGAQYHLPNGRLVQINTKEETLFHNKPAIYTQAFTTNYLKAISPTFLFAFGDPNLRQSIQEMGVMYFFDFLLIILGIFVLFSKDSQHKKWLVVGWLLLAPIPSALTADGGDHATRLILMLPALIILSAFGADFLIGKYQKKRIGFTIFLAVVSLIAIINVTFYFHRYYLHYPAESWRWWQTGYQEVFDYVKQNQNNYQTIVINNSYEPSLLRYLFYMKYDPATFQRLYQGDKIVENIIPGVRGFTFDKKVYFGNITNDHGGKPAIEQVMKPGMMYVASARDETGQNFSDGANFKIAKTIYNPMGDAIFYILISK